jgi:integrase
MNQRAPKKPTVIKYGSVGVKIYHGQRGGYELHKVAYYDNGILKRESFGSLEDARARANDVAELLAAGKAEVTTLSREDVNDLHEGRKWLEGSGLTVRESCRRIAELLKVLDGRCPVEAARYFVRMHPKELQARQVAEVAAEMYLAKERLGKSSAYVHQLKHQCGKFARMFSKTIADVSAADLRMFVESLDKLSPRTRNNVIAGVRELFSFARRQKYIPKDFDQLDGIELFDDRAGNILIFTPVELASIFAHASTSIIPALAVGAFAGLRRSEVARLDWSEIDLKGRFITISAEKAKTRARRLVPISSNLAAWLMPYAKKSGPFLSMTEDDYGDRRVAAAKAAGLGWRRNALRHSFCSYRLAQTQDAAKVSLEAGNSPAMIFQHYRELVRPADARRWFAISPKKSANVVPLRAAIS